MPPTLSTSRLLLRPLAPEDEQAMYDTLFSDPEVMRFLPGGEPHPRDWVEGRAAKVNEGWQKNGVGYWAVEERSSGRFVGQCGLNFIEDTGEVEVLYALGKRWWGLGYATEGATASLEYGFGEAGLEKIIALAVPANRASRHVMEKIGMAYERDGRYFDLDVVVYGITRPPA